MPLDREPRRYKSERKHTDNANVFDEVALHVLHAHHLSQTVGPRVLEERVLRRARLLAAAPARAARLLLLAGAVVAGRRGAVRRRRLVRRRQRAPPVVQEAAAAMREYERPVAVREVVRHRHQEHFDANQEVLPEGRENILRHVRKL